MDGPKLLVVAIDGIEPKLSFARKGLQVTWETIVHDLINSNYCFAFEVRDIDYYDAKECNRVAVLKFQASRKYAFIYGWVTTNEDVKYDVCFDVLELNQTCTTTTTTTEVDNIESLTCCLLCLPDEIKLKIVESLDGVELAKLGCVCSEFRNLTSDEGLWKHKFLLEFSDRARKCAEGENLWKRKFAKAWREKKFNSMTFEVPVGAMVNHISSKNYSKFILENCMGYDYQKTIINGECGGAVIESCTTPPSRLY